MGCALNPKSIQISPHPQRTRGFLSALLIGPLPLFILCSPSFLTNSEASDRPFAWIALGPGGQSVVRAVTTQDVCPDLRVETQPYPLQIRSRPSSSSFPILICEALLPSQTTLVTVEGVLLSLPKSQPEKIVILGDTGCRVQNRLAQACNDPDAWPFAQIARSAAAWRPDLVIHLGDYFYRDSPCPIGNVSCAGSPWGDNWAVAQADFFSPARPLLQVAPWIFVRGNHEACGRTGAAWFRLLDPRPLREQCTDATQSYVVPFGERDLFVLDTTNAHDSVPQPDSVTYFARQFSTLAEQSKRPAWLLSHKPVWAFGSLGQENGVDKLFRTNPTLQAAAQQSFAQTIELILSGHLHKVQFLQFAQGKPLQFVVGNGGALLDPPLSMPVVGMGIADRQVTRAEGLAEFGYVTLERDGDGWILTPHDVHGAAQKICQLKNEGLTCAPPDRAARPRQ